VAHQVTHADSARFYMEYSDDDLAWPPWGNIRQPVLQRVLLMSQPSAVAHARCTCSCWYVETQQNEFWKQLYRAQFGGGEMCNGSLSWLAEYFNDALLTCPSAINFMEMPRTCRPRAGHAAVLLDGGQKVLLLFGATDGFEFLDDAEVFDIKSGTSHLLEYIQPSPSPRWLHCAAQLGDDIWLCGGKGHHGIAMDSVWRLADLRQWRQSELHLPVAGHSMTKVGNGLLIFGGQTSLGLLSSATLRFDGVTVQALQVAPSPSPRFSHAACAAGSALCICGGWAPESSKPQWPSTDFLSDLWLLQPDAGSWFKLESVGGPSPRCQSALWPHGDHHVILFGGATHHKQPCSQNYGDILDDLCSLHVYNLQTRTWLPLDLEEPGLRGGVVAFVTLPGGDDDALLLGGMHSDAGDLEPTFHRSCWRVKLPMYNCDSLP